MHPREERPLPGFQPRAGLADDFVGAALDLENGSGDDLGLLLAEIGVGVEPLGDAEASVEHEGGDETGRGIAGGAQHLGKREGVVLQAEGAVVAHPVAQRQLAGEDRCVCRQRRRHRGCHLLEAHPFARQAVEVGRLDVLVSIGSEVVGAQRIERYQ